jgi:hypothetical protein
MRGTRKEFHDPIKVKMPKVANPGPERGRIMRQ